MRIGYASTTQTQYYDRSPISKFSTYSGAGVAPHGITQRWVYTVPTGKKAYLQAMTAVLRRDGAAGAAGQAASYNEMIPASSGGGTILEASENTNGIGVENAQVAAYTGLMAAGDIIDGTTFDQSTGGTYRILNSAWYTEFNAAT